jgi:magnesium transporter
MRAVYYGAQERGIAQEFNRRGSRNKNPVHAAPACAPCCDLITGPHTPRFARASGKPMLSKKLEQQKSEWAGYLNSGQPHLLRESLLQVHPADQAEIMRTLADAQIAAILNLVEDSPLRTLFRFMRTDKGMRLRVLRALPPQRLANVLSAMNAAAVAEILKGFSEAEVDEIIAGLASQKKRDIQASTHTEQQGVALLMTRDALTVRSEKPVRDVINLLHNMTHSEGRPSQIYVVDHRGLLCGMIDLHLLLLAPDPDKPIETIMKECPLRIQHRADPLDASRSLLYYGMGSAPVVNAKNELLGAFTAESAYRLLESDHDANLNCIGVVSGATDVMSGERAATALRHSLALAPIMLLALAASVVLRLVFFPHPAESMAALLPWTPMLIAVNRLYYRHVSLLLQKRSVAREYGAAYRGRRVQSALLVGAAFAPVAGAAAGLFNGVHLLFGATLCCGVLLSVFCGSLTAWALFRATQRNLAPRSAYMTPSVLSVGDLMAIAGTLALYQIFMA